MTSNNKSNQKKLLSKIVRIIIFININELNPKNIKSGKKDI